MKRKAIVRFLGKNEGGRYNPPMAGYKPHLKIGRDCTSCFITPQNPSIITMDFGTEHEVFVELMFEDLYLDELKKLITINLYEGSKLIGVGYFTD